MLENPSVLVVRGDLGSGSEPSQLASDFCPLLACYFDQVVGVDLPDPGKSRKTAFPYPVVTEAAARSLASRAGFALTLTVNSPDDYTVYANAINIGLVAWDADAWPIERGTACPWVIHANRMDALWAVSTHSAEVLKKAGVTARIRVIPCPLGEPKPVVAELPTGTVYALDRRPPFAEGLLRLTSFRAHRYGWSRRLMNRIRPRLGAAFLRSLRVSSRTIQAQRDHLLFSTAPGSPRKGLGLLLSEWVEFRHQVGNVPWSLLIQASPGVGETPAFDLVAALWEQLQGLKRQLTVPSAGVFLWASPLSLFDADRLLARVDACIFPSLGEGNGKAAAAALLRGKPILAPRHTAFADLLPARYPYIIASQPSFLHFAGDPQAACFGPAPGWSVPTPWALTRAFMRLTADSAATHEATAAQARTKVLAWCSGERVQDLLDDELARLRALRNRKHSEPGKPLRGMLAGRQVVAASRKTVASPS
jgi:glycosyltransferase involved in cell wall biosynthesis